MRVAADTNVLVYAEGLNDESRRAAASRITGALSLTGRLFIPVQALGELYRVLRRKGNQTPQRAAFVIAFWTEAGFVGGTSTEAFSSAVQLAAANGLDIWDAVILAAAIEARCDILLSEDMQHGFSWGGCTIVNPFASQSHPLLEAALAPEEGARNV